MTKQYILKQNKQGSSNSNSRFLDELNDSQKEAASHIEGPALVIAGAGSGKTRTLIYRVAHLVENGVDPARILLLTFTRRASQEMLRRASDVLDERCSNVSGGTFHSFGNLLLRRYGERIGLPSNFTIMDRSDAEDVIQIIRVEMGFHKNSKRFPKKKTILDVISRSINQEREIIDLLDENWPHFSGFAGEIRSIQERYQQYKMEKGLLDYDDLLVHVKLLLSTCADVREKVSNYYSYIMVDEYQDTNRLQAYIACLLAAQHQNLMVVGDDSQSIYAFRGADFKNIMNFPALFENAKVIRLEENYRSVTPILDLANAVVSNMGEKFEKNLFSRKKSSQKPVFLEIENENEQSDFICQKILELREEGVPLNEIAVLFRNGWHSNDLEISLSSHNIPFKKFGGIKFVEASHIKDLIAHIKVYFNERDAVAWMRILLLLEGIGAKTAEGLIRSIVDENKGFDWLIDKSLQKKKFAPCLQKLHDFLLQLKELSSPAEVITYANNYYYHILKNTYDDFHKRKNDLDALVQISEKYADLEEFLVDLSLEPPEKSQVDTQAEDEDDEKVILSTIHSSKGLEWHTVFIIHLVDGWLPSARSLHDETEIDEERRLFYVACTRSKQNLFLSRPIFIKPSMSWQNPTGNTFSMPSRFLLENELSQKYTEKWNVKREVKADSRTSKKEASSKQDWMNKINDFFNKHQK